MQRIFLLLMLACLTGCSSTPPTKGELVVLERACDKSNDGKRVTVEGYLMLPDQVSGDFSVVLRVLNNPERNQQAIVSTTLRVDKERKAPNTMDNLPSSYSDASLIFRTNDGQTLGYQDKVHISGTVYFPASTATVEFTCGLDNPLIEKAQ